MSELRCIKSLTGEGLVRLECDGQIGIREADCWALYGATHTGVPLFQRRTTARETENLDLIVREGWHEPMNEENVCEHGDHPSPEGRRFCSDACSRCEHESQNEETGCDGICRGAPTQTETPAAESTDAR